MTLRSVQLGLSRSKAIATHNRTADGLPKIGAVLETTDRRLFFGQNQRKTHPFQARWGRTEHHVYLHAEIDALRHAVTSGCQPGTFKAIYVSRIGKHGESRLARPCEGCMAALAAFQVNNIYWSE